MTDALVKCFEQNPAGFILGIVLSIASLAFTFYAVLDMTLYSLGIGRYKDKKQK